MTNLMTKLSITGLISTSLLLSPMAFAGHSVNHHSNYNKHHKKHYNSYKRHHHKVKHHHKLRHKHRHHHRHSHTGAVVGGIIGGVVIGSILADANASTHVTTTYSKPYYHHGYRTTVYQPPVAVNKTIIVNNTPTQTYRVLNGTDCYLVNYNNQGNEVLTQVPGVNCGF